MKSLLTLSIILAGLFAQTQTMEMILIGDSKEKARKIVKEMSNMDPDFKFEEYNGWYEGIDDYVNQYSIWGTDSSLLKSVFVVGGKVILHAVLSSEPPANTTHAELDKIQKRLRSKAAMPDIEYMQKDTYKILMNNKFYSYRKHLVFYMPNKAKIQTYIIEASDFDQLQRYTNQWTTMAQNKLHFRYF